MRTFSMGVVLAVALGAGTRAGEVEQNGSTMQGITYQGITYQGASYQGASYQGITYQGASYQGASYQGASYQGASYQGSSYQGSSYQGLDYQGSTLQGMTLQGMNMQGINMQGVRMQGMTMQGMTMQGVNMQGVDLRSPLGAELAGGRLQVRTAAGVLEGDQLDGMDLPMVASNGTPQWVHVADAKPDPEGRDLTFLTLTHEGKNVCADGGPGILVPGSWGADGTHAERSASIDTTFSCMSGVVAKCVLWGYEPWDGEASSDLHRACVRLAMADYCGNGVPHTENGTQIDLFDGQGIQKPANIAEMSFEAGWGPDGAVCVSRPRYADIDSAGQKQLPSCWASKPRCDDWTEATRHGATIGNRSFPRERRVD